MDLNFTLITQTIESFAILTASFVAIYGIWSWRREAKWKRKYELAEEVRSLFYDAQERIQIIRNPMSHTDEGKTRKRAEAETKEESERLDQAYIIRERFEKEKEPFFRLRVLKFRFIVVYGKKAGEPFDELVRLVNDIFFAANRLALRYWKDQGRKKFTEEQFEKHLSEMHKFESIIWADFQGEDEIRNRMEQIVLTIEKICSGVIAVK